LKARDLVSAYRLSEWRKTRVAALKRMRLSPHPRTIQLLMEVVIEPKDLGEAALALRSLAQMRDPFANAAFISLRERIQPALLTDWVEASSAVPWLKVKKILQAEWSKLSFDHEETRHAEAVILGLSEFRDLGVEDRLLQLLEEDAPIELKKACFIALGAVSRNPEKIELVRSTIQGTPALDRLAHAAIKQTTYRKAVSLEQVIETLISDPKAHAHLSYELGTFPEEEVRAAVEGLPGLKVAQVIRLLHGLDAPWVDTLLIHQSWTHEDYAVACQYGESRFPSLSSLDTKAAEISILFENGTEGFKKLIEQGLQESNESKSQVAWLNLWQVAHVLGKRVTLPRELLFSGTDEAKARAIRAIAEMQETAPYIKDFEGFARSPSVLIQKAWLYFGASLKTGVDCAFIITEFLSVNAATQRELLPGLLELLAQQVDQIKGEGLAGFVLRYCQQSDSLDESSQIALLRIVRRSPNPEFEEWVLKMTRSESERVCVHAVVALGSYRRSQAAVGRLLVLIDATKSPSVLGRTVDSLLRIELPSARAALVHVLEKHSDDAELVDVIFRRFKPIPGEAEPTLVAKMDALIRSFPNAKALHQWMALRDRLGGAGVDRPQVSLPEVDTTLIQDLPEFKELPAVIQATLRSAELLVAEGIKHDRALDQAPALIQWCKAIDLTFDRRLGADRFFPLLENRLSDVQKLMQSLGLREDYLAPDRFLERIGAARKLPTELIPVHKAKTMTKSFFDGRIAEDRFRVFDGLRAWSVILLIFCRKLPGQEAPRIACLGQDDEIINLAKTLMQLQDLRNPAAHRQTYLDREFVAQLRTAALSALSAVCRWFPKI
jgi:hypothetical protein